MRRTLTRLAAPKTGIPRKAAPTATRPTKLILRPPTRQPNKGTSSTEAGSARANRVVNEKSKPGLTTVQTSTTQRPAREDAAISHRSVSKLSPQLKVTEASSAIKTPHLYIGHDHQVTSLQPRLLLSTSFTSSGKRTILPKQGSPQSLADSLISKNARYSPAQASQLSATVGSLLK